MKSKTNKKDESEEAVSVILDEEEARHIKQAKIHAWLLQKEVEACKHQHLKDGEALFRLEQKELQEHRHAQRQAKLQRQRACHLAIARQRDEELDLKLRTAPIELGCRIAGHCAASRNGTERETSIVRTYAAYAHGGHPTSMRCPKPRPPKKCSVDGKTDGWTSCT